MTVISFVACAVLAVALVIQSSRARQQQAKIESLQLQVEDLAQQTRASESEIQELQKERSALRSDLIAAERDANKAARAEAAAVAPGTAQLPTPPTVPQDADNGNSGSGNLRNMLGNMLKNPEMRKAMEEQQRLGINMMYGSLLKRLGLTPEQEQGFKDILLEQQMSNMSQAGAMFDGGTNRMEALQRIVAQQKERDQQFKDLMGEEKFAQYQEYNQTVGERMMLEQFGKDVEMTPEQKDQLLDILKEEKKNIQLSAGIDTSDPNKANMEAVSSPEATEKLMAVQEQVNARLMERAPEILSPEQVRKLEPVMKSQLEFQRAGMKMARQMFGGEGAGQPAPPPPEGVK